MSKSIGNIGWKTARHIFASGLGAVLIMGSSAWADDGYSVGPLDVVMVEVFGEDTLTRPVAVTSQGNLELPHIGALAVNGLTTGQIAQVVTERYADGWLVNPQVSVKVDQYRSKPVEVLGPVKEPGTHYLTGTTTLREMLGEVGWVDTSKSSNMVVLTRADGDRATLRLDDIMSERGSIELRAGDVVNVEEGKYVYVSGEVSKPGAVPYIEGLRVSQALTLAGGPAQTARLRGAYVLRGEERISINLRRIQDGKDADFNMEAGDQLFLKESAL